MQSSDFLLTWRYMNAGFIVIKWSTWDVFRVRFYYMDSGLSRYCTRPSSLHPWFQISYRTTFNSAIATWLLEMYSVKFSQIIVGKIVDLDISAVSQTRSRHGTTLRPFPREHWLSLRRNITVDYLVIVGTLSGSDTWGNIADFSNVVGQRTSEGSTEPVSQIRLLRYINEFYNLQLFIYICILVWVNVSSA